MNRSLVSLFRTALLGFAFSTQVVTDSAAAESYTIGSSKQVVIRLQGTPDDINRWAALGYEEWHYGRSTVQLSLMTSKVVEYSSIGNLAVENHETSQSGIELVHHYKAGDVTLYYNENKVYKDVLSFENDQLGTV
jgi:hypothetical protein